MLRILSTMERLVEAMMRCEFRNLKPEIHAEILELLSDDDRAVLNMSAVDRESNQLLRDRKQKIMDKVEIIRWLHDQQTDFHEITDDDGTQYKIHTQRSAIRGMPSWKVLVRTRGNRLLHFGYVFYRSEEWILCLTKHIHGERMKSNIHRIKCIAELKQKLKCDETSHERFTETMRDRQDIDTEITPDTTEWMQERINDTRVQHGKLILFKDRDCNWQFQLALEPENHSTVEAVIVRKEEDSKMDIWYEIHLHNDENGQWNLNGYIQDIDLSRAEEIETWPYDTWKRSLYYAENQQRPELPFDEE